MKKNLKLLYIGTLIVICSTLLYITFIIGEKGYILLQRYEARATEKYDYTKITTPLPRNVIDDICLSFGLDTIDKRCHPESVVYGPDFFEDIKAYFWELPIEDRTLLIVDTKLGKYLVRCENPDKDGYYRCKYDLRGDGLYPIFVYFTKEGDLYRIIANTGGS